MKTKLIVTGCLLGILTMSGVARAESIHADVWADNWFAFYLNDKKVAEDHVPITTERSFNSESFDFEAERPYALNFIVKDFKQDDTGLEYIGTRRQQMGDGGFIAQFTSGGKLIAGTTNGWRCLVIHEAPLNSQCAKERNPVAGKGSCGFKKTAEPAGWKSVNFDDSKWPKATEHSAREVGPKDGYDKIRWNRSAKLIWGPDLHTDNTLLCRTVVK